MDRLRAILELTDRVQAAIDVGDWQLAHEIEIERRMCLERAVAENGQGQGMRAALTELEQRNHRLVGVVEHHKRRVLREAATVKTGHSAAACYAETSGHR
jgi:hypothetical protein